MATADTSRYDAVDAPPADGYDLRGLLRATGAGAATGASVAETRTEPKSPVEVLDDGPAEVTAEPLEVAGYLDGVQAIRCLAWRNRRPVNLAYCAAGALGRRDHPIGLAERLFLTASVADHDWVRALPGGLPVLWTPETAPPELPAVLHDGVANLRAHLEAQLCAQLVGDGTASAERPLVVDGDLRDPQRHQHTSAVVGVAKTHRTRWMGDETQLWDLPERWRSATMYLPAHGPVHVDRYSAYVRIWGDARRPWNFGLVRIEVTDRAQLDAACALAISQRQAPGAPDGRWDRQLELVRGVEEWLATRRPLALRP